MAGGADDIVFLDAPVAGRASQPLFDALQQGFLLQRALIDLGQRFAGAKDQVQDHTRQWEEGEEDQEIR